MNPGQCPIGRIVAFVIFLLSSGAAISAPDETKIDFVYSSFWDSMCSFFTGYEIADAWKQELDQKKSLLESEWNAVGHRLLDTTETIVGKKFKLASVTAHLTLCNTPSRSIPVIVNMRYSLSSFTTNPVAIHIKVGTLYHELLHRLVDDNIPKNSPLLQRYIEEDERVLSHLHLMALLKAVYTKLGMTNQLADIVKVDSMLPNGFYKRAWEIIYSTPAFYIEFVRELRS